MRIGLPLSLIVVGLGLIAGSIGLTMYFFEYEGDNAGALFGVTVVPVAVGFGAILILVGMAIALVRFVDWKRL